MSTLSSFLKPAIEPSHIDFKDGVHFDLDYDVYASDVVPGLRFSDFAHGLKEQKKFATTEMRLGVAIHSALLNQEKAIDPQYDMFVEPYNKLIGQYVDEVLSHANDDSELSINYEVTVIHKGFKCRIDLLIITSMGFHIFDLKTIKDIAGWYKNLTQFKYIEQLAWYADLYSKATKKTLLTAYLGFLPLSPRDSHRLVGILPETRSCGLKSAHKLLNIYNCDLNGCGAI